ncbi:MAG TPA: RNA polymerase sigma factor [Gemmatimonadaceae bacterium]|jgi:RNA polymerase sigma-70 factor (ECF subfamily)|nr:RNA polymerase sigma factor [Gemmatimonadaceae bacterium]
MTVAPLARDDVSQDEFDSTTDVALAAAGDRQAFERMYRTHVNRVFSVCVRMSGDRVLAEELTQDVFVRAWAKLTLYRGESAFSTWLHRLAVNVVLNARKTEGRRRGRFAATAEGEDPDDAMPALARTAPAGISIDLEAAIASLPPGARRVFVLHDVEGYKHEEIATMLEITSGGSKAQLHRARMLLREALER